MKILDRFLEDKHDGVDDEFDMMKYPMQFVNPDTRMVRKGYLQDCIKEVVGDEFKMTLIVLDADMSQIHKLVVQCIAPAGSVVDWDNIHCPYQMITSV